EISRVNFREASDYLFIVNWDLQQMVSFLRESWLKNSIRSACNVWAIHTRSLLSSELRLQPPKIFSRWLSILSGPALLLPDIPQAAAKNCFSFACWISIIGLPDRSKLFLDAMSSKILKKALTVWISCP